MDAYVKISDMDVDVFDRLLSATGEAALRDAELLQPQEKDFLPAFTKLQRIYPDELARAALEIVILRRAAQKKFPAARQMFFTREALEQASSFVISSYRAKRFSGYEHIIDLGCSIGGDTLALAAYAPVLGIDLDALRLAMARENLRITSLGKRASFVCADLRADLPIIPSTSVGLFFDPARRSYTGRAFSIYDYQPPLPVVKSWLPRFPDLGVKISPGVKLAELSSYPAEIEFISLHGELKEAVLWFGGLKTTVRRATVLPGAFSLDASSPWPAGDLEKLVLDEPRAYIYEPDPAILRAGLVRELAHLIGAAQLDPDIAYLTSDRTVSSPFARCWRVDEWFPFQLKRLREALRQRRVGQVTVKKRGSPLQPEVLIHSLRLQGDQQRVIFLTHLRGKPVVILAQELN